MPEDEPVAAEPEFFEVWYENWTCTCIFNDLRTQWRKVVISGMGGGAVIYDGLPYELLLASGGLFDLYHVKAEARLELLHDIQLMESSAMIELNKQKK